MTPSPRNHHCRRRHHHHRWGILPQAPPSAWIWPDAPLTLDGRGSSSSPPSWQSPGRFMSPITNDDRSSRPKQRSSASFGPTSFGYPLSSQDMSTKASRQSTLGYTHGSSLSVDGAQTTNLTVTQDTDKVFIQVRPLCGRNTYVLRLIVLNASDMS